MSPGKKDDSAAHQWGSGTDEVVGGRRDGVSSRAATLRRASVMAAVSCSTGVSREVREAD
jgi:hypothetical protein